MSMTSNSRNSFWERAQAQSASGLQMRGEFHVVQSVCLSVSPGACEPSPVRNESYSQGCAQALAKGQVENSLPLSPFLLMFLLYLQSEREWGRGGERGNRGSEAALHPQWQAQCGTRRSRPEQKSQKSVAQRSQPGAPSLPFYVPFFYQFVIHVQQFCVHFVYRAFVRYIFANIFSQFVLCFKPLTVSSG